MKFMKRVNSTLYVTLFSFALFFSVLVFGQVQKPVYVSMSPNTKAYYEYLPSGYDPNGSENYPLLLFFHGTGEQGGGSPSELSMVLRNGPPHVIKEGEFPESFNVKGNTYKFIVISPQFIHWPSNADVQIILDYLISNYKVDVTRIYLSGLSMGGGVVWNYAGGSDDFANRLAAISTACGASYPAIGRINTIADANLPVWSFHNSGDPTVPVSWTTGYINGLNEAGINPAAKKTIFQTGGHDSWSRAYDPNYKENGMNVYEWMLQYSTEKSDTASTPPPTPNKVPVVDAGANISVTLLTNSVSFGNATASDPDGSIATYYWKKVSGPSQYSFSKTTALNPTVSNLVTGIYKFRLYVTDNDGAIAHDDIVVTVLSLSDDEPDSETTKTINVSINDGTLYNNSEWNNWVLSDEEVSDISSGKLNYSDGNTSPISATLSYSLKLTDNTINYVEGMAPREVLRYTSCSEDARTLVITGLSQNKTYDIDLFSSRSVRYNSTIYNVGKEGQNIPTYFNATNDALFDDLKSDSKGTITIYIRSGTIYNYLNGFTITENPAINERKAVITKTSSDIELLKTAPNSIAPSFSIYPNPVKDKFMVQLNYQHTGSTSLRVVDISGKVRRNINFKKDYTLGNVEVYAKDLPAGTYMVQVQTGNFSETKKIVKL